MDLLHHCDTQSKDNFTHLRAGALLQNVITRSYVTATKLYGCVLCVYCVCGICVFVCGMTVSCQFVSNSISSATYSWKRGQRGTTTMQPLGLQIVYQLNKQGRTAWFHASVTRKESAWPAACNNFPMNNVIPEDNGAAVQNNQAYNHIFKFHNSKAEHLLGLNFIRDIVVHFALIFFFSQ